MASKLKSNDKQTENAAVAQFCGVTGASVKDAKKFLDKHKRLDYAIDAYYNDPFASVAAARRPMENSVPSTSKLNTLFDRYKDRDSDEISVDGTITLCTDLDVDPEDVVMLAVAYELQSPRVGEWNRKGWVEGWKRLGCDSIPGMKAAVVKLQERLSSEPRYFQQVYNHTFDFARGDGQRSISLEIAQAFWELLLPAGLQGEALSHIASSDDDDDVDMGEEEGWQPDYTEWWFEFLKEKGGKGISKDTWIMFLDFVRTIDSKFDKYDMEGEIYSGRLMSACLHWSGFAAAWPSTIDDFVEWARRRLARGG